MKPEIKQRIEQIKAGQVPDGYKKTKIGIVPTEWNNTCFSDLFVSKSKYTEDLEKYPLYSLTIEDGVTAKSERYERSHLVKKENAYKIVEPDDFTYNPMNVRFGAVARHKGNIPVCVSGYYDIFTTTQKRDLKFMDSFLVSNMMIKYYNKVSTGSLVEKQRVHFSEFIEFDLPIPCPEEREKIAKILSAQDKVIELKEKLLVEKRKQKKYLMQQLLTGKKRLPGFSGEWEKHKLGEFIIEHTEKTTKNNQYPVLTSSRRGLFLQSDYYNKEVASEDNTGYNVVPRGFFTYRHMSDDEIFKFNINNIVDRGIVSTLYPVFTTKNICNHYLQSLLNEGNEFKKFALLQKQGGSRTYMYLDKLKQLYVSVPCVEEQEAISRILLTCDNEIELLQKSFEQEKQKKKALMQLLLMGIVRV